MLDIIPLRDRLAMRRRGKHLGAGLQEGLARFRRVEEAVELGLRSEAAHKNVALGLDHAVGGPGGLIGIFAEARGHVAAGDQANRIGTHVLKDRRLAGARVHRAHARGAEDIAAGADIHETNLRNIDAIFLQKGDDELVQQSAKGAGADHATLQILQTLDVGLAGEKRQGRSERGRRDDLELGALFNRRKDLPEARHHGGIEIAAQQAAENLGSVSHIEECWVEPEFLHIALLSQQFLHRQI